jgi:predicted DNA-binding antitoxin AbrB/MazE fold protein
MPITVEAVYENGVLRPVQPLPLGEREKVSVTIESTSGWADRTSGILKWTGDPAELRRYLNDPDEGILGSS